MTKSALVLLSLLSLAAPACVVHTQAPRDVGSINADGSVFLGWHLLNRDNKGNNGNDSETYDIGAQVGNFSSIRLFSDRPISIAQVHVIFANGERWDAPAPPVMNANEWTGPIQLPGGPRPIHSIIINGRSTSSLLAKVEIHGGR
jgi:hypothetical protein